MSNNLLLGILHAPCKATCILLVTIAEPAQGNYSIDCEAGEPDPHIIDLNTELGECDDLVSSRLPNRERQ